MIAAVAIAGTAVAINYFSENSTADAAGGPDTSDRESLLSPSKEFSLTNLDVELPAGSYAGVPVYDACALAPMAELTELGLEYGQGTRREALDSEVPADAALDHMMDPVSFCSYALAGRPTDALHISVLQEPYVDYWELDRRSRHVEGVSHDYGSGITGVTWDEVGLGGEDEYRFMIMMPEVIVEGRLNTEVSLDGYAHNVEAVKTLTEQIAALVAENMAEDPVRGQHGHVGYEDAPTPCGLLSPEVFGAAYGTPYSAPFEEYHYGREQHSVDSVGRTQVYVESDCTRRTNQNHQTPDEDAHWMKLVLQTHRTEESAVQQMVTFCDPDDPLRVEAPSHPLNGELGDEACLTGFGRPEGFDLAIRVGTNVMTIHTRDSYEHTEPAPTEEMLMPIGEQIVASM
ncbi:hypothetical protein [Actinoalloteichus hymeniacidonis]|uniref:hypothetical protein n=1 Tax=Actinoalloteichus hymeniacidonis TaxID=340345 RepID=UPI0012FCC1BC|nr:hypothetical protein [Actinoalloteichus hymeniacidonis]MBB5911062.1 hypothetical protein [Actinoalloteichus hymeniacidonis]